MKQTDEKALEPLDLFAEEAPLDYRELAAEEMAQVQYNAAATMSTWACMTSYTSTAACASTLGTYS